MARATPQEKLAIEERQRQVAALYLKCVTQEEIGRELGVSQMTISRDIKAIREAWKSEREDLLDREAASLDDIERECAERYDDEKDAEWIKLRLDVKKRRAAMLGLDAPTKQQLSGTEGGTPVFVERIVIERATKREDS